MSVEFKNSKTKENLMCAFAGESQARNRYTFAAGQADKLKQQAIGMVFRFTADQEKEHAEIFYNHLKELAGENIEINGAYPIDISDSLLALLKAAHHNEYEEFEDIYQSFGDTAAEEGFPAVAHSFYNIAQIEKVHGDRFMYLANLIEQGKLFVSDVKCEWVCLNCGHVMTALEAPEKCPVCQHDQGYFVRVEFAPYTK